jgi:hypothetical protein
MGDVLNRTTKEFLKSVNTPDYDPADWIVNPDLKDVSGVDSKYWVIEGDAVRSMDNAEKVTNLLPAAMMQKYKALDADIAAYLGKHYDNEAKQSLLASWIEGVDKKYLNRIALIGSVWEWVQKSISVYKVAANAIFAATSFSELDAVTWDFSQFDASDPVVSVVTVQETLD